MEKNKFWSFQLDVQAPEVYLDFYKKVGVIIERKDELLIKKGMAHDMMRWREFSTQWKEALIIIWNKYKKEVEKIIENKKSEERREKNWIKSVK
jgi:hypothetical protein